MFVESIESLSDVRIMEDNSCSACGSEHTSVFFESSNVPIDVGYLWPTREQALDAPTGDIRLAYCHACGFIGNCAFEPDRVSYEPGYEVSLHHSPRYRAFLNATVARLVDRYDLYESSIVEIGAGMGVFLKQLCERGSNRGFGIDPCIETEGVFAAGAGSMEMLRDVYDERYAQLHSNLVCCRHVLQHIPNPDAFIRTVHRTILNQINTKVYFELPNASFVFLSDAVWTVFYEHCSYFTPDVLIGLFLRNGFEVLNAGPCYDDGQYLYIEAEPVGYASFDADFEITESLPASVQSFADRYRQKVAMWTSHLKTWSSEQKRVVSWGSGGRGITFLNAVDKASAVSYVVDINPERQGLFVPGTGRQVVAPEFLVDFQPDVIIITNPTYEHEIRLQARDLGLNCDFLTA